MVVTVDSAQVAYCSNLHTIFITRFVANQSEQVFINSGRSPLDTTSDIKVLFWPFSSAVCISRIAPKCQVAYAYARYRQNTLQIKDPERVRQHVVHISCCRRIAAFRRPTLPDQPASQRRRRQQRGCRREKLLFRMGQRHHRWRFAYIVVKRCYAPVRAL